jgi:hypothetical protein
MSEGRIFVDGPHEIYSITIGDVLRFQQSDEPLHLLGVLHRHGWKAQVGLRRSKNGERPSNAKVSTKAKSNATRRRRRGS